MLQKWVLYLWKCYPEVQFKLFEKQSLHIFGGGFLLFCGEIYASHKYRYAWDISEQFYFISYFFLITLIFFMRFFLFVNFKHESMINFTIKINSRGHADAMLLFCIDPLYLLLLHQHRNEMVSSNGRCQIHNLKVDWPFSFKITIIYVPSHYYHGMAPDARPFAYEGENILMI